MSFWRLDLTVLTDLSASMFAACFMILLIFLSLVQHAGHTPPAALDGKSALRLVSRTVETPAGLVDLLHDHDAPAGTSIDIFADRLGVITPQGQQTMSPTEIARGFGAAARPIRLYVFSNTLYNSVAAVLGGGDWREITIPDALRDPSAPMTAWNSDFVALSAQRLDLPSFREGLGKLLNGGPEPGSGSAETRGASASAPDLLSRLNAWVSFFLGMAMPLIGLVAVVSIEGRRRRLSDDLDMAQS